MNETVAALDIFLPATRQWFTSAFGAPTPVQAAAWSAIASGGNVLAIAPTGSGKTLAAFLYAIDRLFEERTRELAAGASHAETTRVLYISPLKALGADVRRNLNLPLRGVANLQKELGNPQVSLSVGMRTGDTPSSERAGLLRHPPDILITTPESLYLMLTSKARESLRQVGTVIVDEVHAVAGTKRGAHLALSLERLDELLTAPAQRIGLSATVRPVDKVAEFLGGAQPVSVVNPNSPRRLDLKIVVPVEDMSDLPVPANRAAESTERMGRSGSIWFHVEESILDQVLACRSTIVFVNSRGLAERLTARLNELYAERLFGFEAGADEAPAAYHSASSSTGGRASEVPAPAMIARSHHGSVSKERRLEIERDLKSGELRCVVATSSLELGIDMGQVEQVIQVAPPPSVASGLQRVGRSGHQVGGTPSGLIYPRIRRELVDAAVTVENMLAGEIEAIQPPRNPLDILAQHTVAQVAMQQVAVDDWYNLVRRAAPFKSLPRSAFDATLDMLGGRYSSEEFAEFRPRLVWDRLSGQLSPRPGAQRLAVINGGTIPDRGAFSVVLPEGEEQAGSRKVGELDEEMVYESRVNDVINLGASSWRIQQITGEQVVVVPAPGRSARLPFWHGDGPGRPAELGRAIGAFMRHMDMAEEPQISVRLSKAGLDKNSVANLQNLLAEQKAATGALPTDSVLVIERCLDEVGDWRVMLHSPYGRRVHAPWALAIAERIRQHFNVDASIVASDNGIVARVPNTEGRWPGLDLFVFEPESIQQLVTAALGNSSLFTARFRECAARALLLPRKNPGRRSPLWQQRLRSAQLLEVTREHPDFPILIEAARECLQDVYDLPALRDLLERIASGAVTFVQATTDTPSAFATNLLFGYIGEFMYEYDSPLAERRSALLSLDPGLLADLLGQTELGELLDPKVLAQVGLELQRLAPERRAHGGEGVADLLRELGPLSLAEITERLAEDAASKQTPQALAMEYLRDLESARRVIKVRMADEERWAAVEDAARLRDALGLALPDGIPVVFLEPGPDPLRDLTARYARTHPPFTTGQVAARLGLGVALVERTLVALQEQGKLLQGDFGLHPRTERGGPEPSGNPAANHQWVWQDVFKRLRSRSLQAARAATRPVERAAYVRQLLERQHLVDPEGSPPQAGLPAYEDLRGEDGVLRVVEQLAGLALPASLWESWILPARVRDYAPGLLEQLLASGEVIWTGHGRIGAADKDDGLISLHLRDFAAETLPIAQPEQEDFSALQADVLAAMQDGGAYFARQIAEKIVSRTGISPSDEDMEKALWGLVWAGRITADTWGGLRAHLGGRVRAQSQKSNLRRRPGRIHRQYDYGRRSEREGPLYDGKSLGGRWSLLPGVDLSETARALALAESMLDRYGVVTRGTAVAEKIPGGFPQLQRVFRGLEDAGRILRGKFVQGLGAAQFAGSATIDRLRELSEAGGPCVVLSAADPANPYGVSIPWPAHSAKSKPTRRPGALVVISGGGLKLWLAQGGRQLLTFLDASGQDQEQASILAEALVGALKRANSGSLTIESIDDGPADASALSGALRAAGFSYVPRGLIWYGRPRQ